MKKILPAVAVAIAIAAAAPQANAQLYACNQSGAPSCAAGLVLKAVANGPAERAGGFEVVMCRELGYGQRDCQYRTVTDSQGYFLIIASFYPGQYSIYSWNPNQIWGSSRAPSKSVAFNCAGTSSNPCKKDMAFDPVLTYPGPLPAALLEPWAWMVTYADGVPTQFIAQQPQDPKRAFPGATYSYDLYIGNEENPPLVQQNLSFPDSFFNLTFYSQPQVITHPDGSRTVYPAYNEVQYWRLRTKVSYPTPHGTFEESTLSGVVPFEVQPERGMVVCLPGSPGCPWAYQ